jgi:hypothetical protein
MKKIKFESLVFRVEMQMEKCEDKLYWSFTVNLYSNGFFLTELNRIAFDAFNKRARLKVRLLFFLLRIIYLAIINSYTCYRIYINA